MVADSKSVSPSAAKPVKVVESWQRQFPIEIRDFEQPRVEWLYAAHDKQFVDDVLACKTDNGFGNRSPEVAASLLYTSGAMRAAALHAMATRRIAVAPVSGFHHACYSGAEDFCTFNGLIVAALALREYGARRIGILDLDMHYGNGTDDIIHQLNLDWVRHYTGGQHFQEPTEAGRFFDQLPDVLDWLGHCDVVLYQAGADPHIDDPYGGWLTTEQLRQRDAMVFEAFREMNVPVAWDLAGGYQVEPDGTIPKILEIHDNTMRECVRVYGT
jgi:acetoin utilization deacetylase AcuC-like enzyme